MNGEFLPVPGGQLSIERAGTRTTVLPMHAEIADPRMRDDQVTALAGHYHVIRYDPRGFGRSTNPRKRFPPVADLDAVLDHLLTDAA